MEELFPLLFILMVYGFIASTVRSAKKKGGPAGGKKPSGSGPAAPAGKLTQKGGLDARLAREFPHLYQQAAGQTPAPAEVPRSGSLPVGELEGTDPCHDDPHRMPSGSLRVDWEEGTDPCHDDPRAMPSGSLRADRGEGTDPCHDGWTPAKPAAGEAEERPAPAGGLNLGWTGDEIVRGFVYGEILRRKSG